MKKNNNHKYNRHTTHIILIVFILALLIPLIFFNFEQNRISEIENRTMANIPTIFDKEGAFNLHKSDIENWIQDNIGFRNTFIKFASNIQYSIFNKLPTQTLLKGIDNWYFYTGNYQMDIINNRYPLSIANLEKIKNTQLKVYQILQSRGKQYILVFPPSKVSIYPEKINPLFDYKKTPEDIVADYLEMHTTIPIIRLKETLINSKADSQLYFKTDTHWNNEGMFIAYKQITQKLHEWKLIDLDEIQVEYQQAKHLGDLTNHLANTKLIPPEKYTNLYFKEVNFKETNNNTLVELSKIRGFFHFSYTNASKSGKILVYGDSMFGINTALTLQSITIPKLLANHVGETSFIWYAPHTEWNNQFKLSDIMQIDPDIVIFEMTERFLYLLTNDLEF